MCNCNRGPSRSSSRSRYSRADQHAPARSPAIVVTPMPRRSMFRDAASIAGGVTVGTTMGHLAGEAIASLFTGRRREEVVHSLPHDYQLGTEPSGPCAYEIAQFLQCATNHENLQECAAFNEALRECKRRNPPGGNRPASPEAEGKVTANCANGDTLTILSMQNEIYEPFNVKSKLSAIND